MTPTDRIRVRTVQNLLKMIAEHLEAMRRDSHGLEYGPWRTEVDQLWKRTFELVDKLAPRPQQACLDMLREPWTAFVTNYVAADTPE